MTGNIESAEPGIEARYQDAKAHGAREYRSFGAGKDWSNFIFLGTFRLPGHLIVDPAGRNHMRNLRVALCAAAFFTAGTCLAGSVAAQSDKAGDEGGNRNTNGGLAGDNSRGITGGVHGPLGKGSTSGASNGVANTTNSLAGVSTGGKKPKKAR